MQTKDLPETVALVEMVDVETIKEIYGTDRVKSGQELENQLHMARYVFHKVKCKVYHDACLRGEMTIEQAHVMYTMSMTDYDKLMAGAVEGTNRQQNEDDMEAGFPL